MQSTSTDAGTYTLTVTFEIGTNLDFAQVLVQNRVERGAGLAAGVGPGAGPDGAEEVDLDPADRVADLAGRPLRQPVSSATTPPSTWSTSWRACRASATSQVLGVGQYSMRIWLDPQKLYTYGLTPREVIQAIQEQSQPVTAGQVGTPPAPQGPGLPVHGRHPGPARARPSEFANIIVKTAQRQRRPHPAAEGRRRGSSSAPRPTRRTFKLERQAGRRHRHLPAARGQRARRRQPRSDAKMAELGKALPAGPRLRRAVRHHRASSRPRSTRCS